MPPETLSAEGLLADLAGDLREDPALTIEFCGFVLGVHCERAIAQRLRHYYQPFIAEGKPGSEHVIVRDRVSPSLTGTFREHRPDPGKRPKEEYMDFAGGRVVRKVRTGMVFVIGEPASLAIGPAADNLNQVINFIDSRYMHWQLRRGGTLLHAAGVCLGEAGLVLAGLSGTGKSTLALHLMSRGLSFVSNDRVILREEAGDRRMYGLAKQPRVNPGTILHHPQLRVRAAPLQVARWERLPAGELWHLEEKHDVDIEEVFGAGRRVLQARFTTAVVLDWRRVDLPPRLERADFNRKPEWLSALMKAPGLFAGGGEGKTIPDRQGYERALRDCGIVAVTGGVDFALLSDTLAGYLADPRRPLPVGPAGS